MFRLIAFLLATTISVGGFLFVDYSMAKRWASSEDAEGLTFVEYLSGFTGRLTGSTAAAKADAALPTALADMMPTPPEGWTVRPATAEDTDVFMPKQSDKSTKDARRYVEAVAKKRSGKGVEQVALTYEKGNRRVIFQAVRYPNIIFTSFMAMQQRMELQMMYGEFRPRDFITVRGLDVSEDVLPADMRARYFYSDVGAQIQIRVLASERMTDEDLVPFFQTLHVKAMNASVVDKQEGLGEVPVIVLASVLDEATRAAYEADRLARAQTEAEQREAARIAAEAEAAAEGSSLDADGKEQDKDSNVLQGEGRLELQGDKKKGGATNCEERAGTKFCGTAGGEKAADE
ncbi:hypothetical protein [Tabrizicola sp.]|uniref:hypothetical protein n=1 Tax=Tabrizicola sp. TaxID=2005166 RepID=UPI00286B10E9|nr:hypothetical protein [Tabrizicola sp.]